MNRGSQSPPAYYSMSPQSPRFRVQVPSPSRSNNSSLSSFSYTSRLGSRSPSSYGSISPIRQRSPVTRSQSPVQSPARLSNALPRYSSLSIPPPPSYRSPSREGLPAYDGRNADFFLNQHPWLQRRRFNDGILDEAARENELARPRRDNRERILIELDNSRRQEEQYADSAERNIRELLRQTARQNAQRNTRRLSSESPPRNIRRRLDL